MANFLLETRLQRIMVVLFTKKITPMITTIASILLPVADLGGSAPPPPHHLFWIKKKKITRGRKASRVSKITWTPPPPPPLPPICFVASSRSRLLPETRFITRNQGATLIGYYFERQSYLATCFFPGLGHTNSSICKLTFVISLERNSDSLTSRGKYTYAVAYTIKFWEKLSLTSVSSEYIATSRTNIILMISKAPSKYALMELYLDLALTERWSKTYNN